MMSRALPVCLTLVFGAGLARAQDGGTAPAAPSPAAATAEAPKPPVKKKRRRPPPPPPPAAELYQLNTHETFKLRPDAKGRFGKAQLHGWNRFLRCHHTGRTHVMATRLAELIYEVDKHFDFKRILVVAGYRAPRVAREKGNPKSPHKKGVACDFRIEGVPNTELRDYERTLPRVGVGYYPNSEFVHLDVDPMRSKHSAFWIDYSKPGERARYSKDPTADLVAEKAAGAEAGGDDDNELAPLTPLPTLPPIPQQLPTAPSTATAKAPTTPTTTTAKAGGNGPQLSNGPGAPAPNNAPALAPTQ